MKRFISSMVLFFSFSILTYSQTDWQTITLENSVLKFVIPAQWENNAFSKGWNDFVVVDDTNAALFAVVVAINKDSVRGEPVAAGEGILYSLYKGFQRDGADTNFTKDGAEIFLVKGKGTLFGDKVPGYRPVVMYCIVPENKYDLIFIASERNGKMEDHIPLIEDILAKTLEAN